MIYILYLWLRSLQMTILSRQVTTVSQELQEMTCLLKPLLHNTSTLLLPSPVTPPPSTPSLGCSPALPILTQHAPADCPANQNPPSVLAPEPSSPPLSKTEALQGEFDLLRCSPSQIIVSQDPPLMAHPHSSSSSIPSLSKTSHLSSIAPLSVDFSGPDGEPRTQPPSRPSQVQLQPRHQSLSQTLLQLPSMTSHPPEPLLNLEESAQLSFIDEGQPPVWREEEGAACHTTHCMTNWAELRCKYVILNCSYPSSWAPLERILTIKKKKGCFTVRFFDLFVRRMILQHRVT